MPSNALSPFLAEDAGPAAVAQSVTPEPELSMADESRLVQPQPQGSQARDIALNSDESDSEAEISPEGGITSDEADDRQGPGAAANPVTASAEDQERQTLAAVSSYIADSEAEGASGVAITPDGALETLAVFGSVADDEQLHHPTLTAFMQHQRRRISGSQHKGSGPSGDVLALTAAQQQHWKEVDCATCDTGTLPSTTVMPKCSGMSTHINTVAADADAADHHRLCAQLDEHPSSQTVVERGQANEAGSSGTGRDDPQLWQNLAEALQDRQACQKLAQLTVTLLARM